MENLIVMQRSELDRLLKEAIESALQQRSPVKANMNSDEALEYLKGLGAPISKSGLYKHTMGKTIPFRRFGSRLVFNADDLDEWMEGRLSKRTNHVTESVRAAAKKKL